MDVPITWEGVHEETAAMDLGGMFRDTALLYLRGVRSPAWKDAFFKKNAMFVHSKAELFASIQVIGEAVERTALPQATQAPTRCPCRPFPPPPLYFSCSQPRA